MRSGIGHTSRGAGVTIRAMLPGDVLRIARQPSQRVQLGLDAQVTPEAAIALAESGEAWAVEGADGRLLACMGLSETYPGVQASAWAVLASDIGSAHLAITRFARARITGSRLRRIEALARCAVPAECAWARLVGLTPAHVLRAFGALSEDHVLFERIA